MQIFRSAALTVVAAVSSAANAVTPEAGAYWDPAEPGRGYVIEYKAGVVSLLIFSHDGAGKPSWYIASAPLRDDAQALPSSEPPGAEGFYPLHWFAADLYRVDGGPCTGCVYADPKLASTKVGSIAAWFPFLKLMTVAIYPTVESADLRRQEKQLVPFNFGRRTFGDLSGNAGWIVDLSGRWFFEEQAGARRTWTFEFGAPTVRTIEPYGYELTYASTQGGTMLRCREGRDAASGVPDTYDGCELIVDGSTILSALDLDVGINRIAGSTGGLSLRGGPLRHDTAVIGVRLER